MFFILAWYCTRPNIRESHSEMSTRVPLCIDAAAAAFLQDEGMMGLQLPDTPGTNGTWLRTQVPPHERLVLEYPPEH